MNEIDILARGSSLSFWNGPRKNVRVWAINHAFLICNHKVDRIFAMHDPREYDPEKKPDIEGDFTRGVKALNDSCAEIVTEEIQIALIRAVLYPHEWVETETGDKFFVNSLAYALGLAVVEGVQKINLYGCDFNDTDNFEIAGVQHWIGFCKGKGIEVTNTPISKLISEYRYLKEKIS